MKKRILSFIMAISVLFTVFIGTNLTTSAGRIQILDPDHTTTSYWAYYEVASTGEYVVNIGFDYNADKTGIVIKQCNGFGSMRSGGWCTVPRKIYGLPVTEIASNAFADKSTSSEYWVKKLILPDTITKIGANAFDGYSGLEVIGFCGTEDEWNNISKNSSNAKLNEVEMKFGETDYYLSYLIEDGEAMVVDCNAISSSILSIPQYVGDTLVTKINPNAFFISDIGTVEIPASVTEICDYAFWDAQIDKFEFSDASRLTKIGKNAFVRNQVLTEIAIPDTVTEIGDSAFVDCKALTKAELPENLTSVAPSLFASCSSLESITIPEKVTTIGVQAFASCSSLTEVTIPKSVNYIDSRAFYDYAGTKALKDVYYGGTEEDWNNITILSDGNEQLSNATIHYTEEEIDPPVVSEYEGTFGDNISWHLDSEGTLTVSGEGAISDSHYGNYPSWLEHSDKVTKLVLEDGITRIGASAFLELPNLSEVVLCDTLSEIGTSAFYYCPNIKSVVIPEGVTKIGNSAFYCTALVEITIPKTVTNIEDYAIYGDGDLEVIYYGGAEDDWNKIDMSDSDREYISENDVAIYFAEKGGSCGENIIWRFNENGTLTISGTGAMTSKPWSSLKDDIINVVIEDGVTSIYNAAFHEHRYLEEITLPDSLTSIESSAFYICPNLKKINLPKGLTKLDDLAFMSCSSLTEITIPSGVGTIGNYAFNGCYGLTSVTLHGGITEIGESAFGGCRSLTDVYFGGTEDEWNEISIESGNDYLLNATIHFEEDDTPTEEDRERFLEILNFYCEQLTSYETVKELMESKGEEYGFNMAKYFALNSKQETVINKFINEAPFDSFDMAVEEFNRIVDRYAQAGGNIGGGGEATASGTCGENLEWYIAGDTLRIAGDGEMYDYEEGQTPWYDYRDNIMSVNIYSEVTSIGKNAFRGLSHITNIVIPDSITSIGEEAFYDCVELKNITLGKGVTFIDEGVFYGCNATENLYISDLEAYINIERVDIDSGQIAPNLYLNNELVTDLIIPEEISELGIFVFSDFKSIVTVTLHGGITEIGENAFSGCNNIREVYYSGTRKSWSTITVGDGNDDLVYHINYDVESEKGEFLFIVSAAYDYTGIEWAIWDYKDMIGLDVAEYEALDEEQRIQALELLVGRNFNTINEFLTALNDAVATVKKNEGGSSSGGGGGELSYEGVCGDNLEWFVTGAGALKILGDGEMYDYEEGQTPWYNLRENITTVRLYDGITRIGKNAFRGLNQITDIEFPDSVETLGEASLWDCQSLKNITLGKNIKVIENDVFMCCDSTENLYISDLSAYINIQRHNFDSGFIAPNLYLNGELVTNLVIPKDITVIGDYVFGGFECFETITIHRGIKEIGRQAFESCMNVHTVNIYKGVEKIGVMAFEEMDRLSVANYEGSADDWAEVEVGGGNHWLLENLVFNAEVEPKVSLNVQLVNDIYLVVPKNLQSGNCIVFACYKDDTLVYSDIFTYSEEIAVPFITDKDFDTVKFMAWEDLISCAPLCESQEF